MIVGISNIGWKREEDAEVLPYLEDWGADFLEIAPTRVIDGWNASNAREALQTYAKASPVPIRAAQSLLFQKPELTLFGSPDALAAHLKVVIDLAACPLLIFGSPRNRTKGALTTDEALDRAAKVFHEVGEYAAARGACLCIEPLTQHDNCDFVCNSAEGLELVRRAASPGFSLHLDSAAMTQANEDVETALKNAAPLLKHFHSRDPAPHEQYAAALRACGYAGGVSVEMPAAPIDRVEAAVRRVRETYGN